MHKSVNSPTVMCTHPCTEPFIIVLLAAISISCALSAPTCPVVPEGQAYSPLPPGQGPSLPHLILHHFDAQRPHLFLILHLIFHLSYPVFEMHVIRERTKGNRNVLLFESTSSYFDPVAARKVEIEVYLCSHMSTPLI